MEKKKKKESSNLLKLMQEYHLLDDLLSSISGEGLETQGKYTYQVWFLAHIFFSLPLLITCKMVAMVKGEKDVQRISHMPHSVEQLL